MEAYTLAPFFPLLEPPAFAGRSLLRQAEACRCGGIPLLPPPQFLPCSVSGRSACSQELRSQLIPMARPAVV